MYIYFMKQVIDNFSKGAADYATFRPGSPDAIFDFLYSHVNSFDAAWDCGTGNGQVALKLAERFKTVYATDISNEQLQHAPKKENIIYRTERAEQTSFPDQSIDLITIAQAIHWFDFEIFYKEVRRVARPGALIAAWTYTVLKLTPEVNKVINYFYIDITHPYCYKERDYVDAGYSTIPFPFEEIPSPVFWIVKHWNMQQLLGYLGTWSGVQHYIKKNHQDPTMLILQDLEKAWGAADTLEVKWPVHMRLGRI